MSGKKSLSFKWEWKSNNAIQFVKISKSKDMKEMAKVSGCVKKSTNEGEFSKMVDLKRQTGSSISKHNYTSV